MTLSYGQKQSVLSYSEITLIVEMLNYFESGKRTYSYSHQTGFLTFKENNYTGISNRHLYEHLFYDIAKNLGLEKLTIFTDESHSIVDMIYEEFEKYRDQNESL